MKEIGVYEYYTVLANFVGAEARKKREDERKILEEKAKLMLIKEYITENEIGDGEDGAFNDNWKAYYRVILDKPNPTPSKLNEYKANIQKKLNILDIGWDDDTNVDDTIVHDENRELRQEVFDLLVAKKGNVRMVLRLNNQGNVMRDNNLIKNALFIGDADLKKSNYSDEIKKWDGIRLKKTEEDEKTFDLYLKRCAPRTEEAGHSKKQSLKGCPNWVAERMKFERIFTTESQESVFKTVEPFVRSALDGKRVGLFAYGGTGSGKTYTIGAESGTSKENEGILPRLLETIMRAKGVTLSYKVIEIVPGWDAGAAELKSRMVDLVGMKREEKYVRNDEGVLKIIQGATIYSPFNTSTIMRCAFDTIVENLQKFTPSQNDIKSKRVEQLKLQKCYQPNHQLTNATKAGQKGPITCVEQPAQVDIDHAFTKVTVTGGDLADILKEYYDIVSFRRSEETVGNSKSSRTHLLTILTLTRDDQTTSDGEIYIINLAGKEA
jgi:hypothetical protein